MDHNAELEKIEKVLLERGWTWRKPSWGNSVWTNLKDWRCPNHSRGRSPYCALTGIGNDVRGPIRYGAIVQINCHRTALKPTTAEQLIKVLAIKADTDMPADR